MIPADFLLNVAVIGADSPIGLTVVRELGMHGLNVLVLSRKPTSLARFSRWARTFGLLRGSLAESLPALLTRHRIGAVLAISESDLVQLAELKTSLPEHNLLVPDSDKLAIVLDKAQTLEIAARIGIDVPASWQPQAGEDFAEKAQELAFPVAVKWADPGTVLPLLEAHRLAFEKVEYADDAPSLLRILARYDALGRWPLVQYRCPGYGFGQMLNMHRGKATLRFQHERLREYPPSGGVSSFCQSLPVTDHAAQFELSERLLQEIGWEGPAMVEYRHDPQTGKYWLMEVNGRFWGSLPLAHHCGVHFAWESYRCQMLDQEAAPQVRYPGRRARFLIPDAKHALAVMTTPEWSIRRRLGTLASFVAGFFDPRVRYYVGSLRDPRPLLVDLWLGLTKFRRRETTGRGA
ncbi:carboxylate--amine ligase [Parerythrobacter aurantius]|uniref:carboxylate--amine ligase n=1 Tax=Parerythrobacter aurantius TaxID=3127706 RepID=UPI0032466930